MRCARPGCGDRAERPLRLVDLGCGNAYLTFAAFRYLSEVRELPVERRRRRRQGAGAGAQHATSPRRSGVRPGVVRPGQHRRRRGCLSRRTWCWRCMPATPPPTTRWREPSRGEAPVVVAAPCCHHDIARQLSAGSTPSAVPAGHATRHPARAARRRAHRCAAGGTAAAVGYRVEVDRVRRLSAHSAQRADPRGPHRAAPTPRRWQAYRDLKSQWEVTPALEPMLRGHPAGAGRSARVRFGRLATWRASRAFSVLAASTAARSALAPQRVGWHVVRPGTRRLPHRRGPHHRVELTRRQHRAPGTGLHDERLGRRPYVYVLDRSGRLVGTTTLRWRDAGRHRGDLGRQRREPRRGRHRGQRRDPRQRRRLPDPAARRPATTP